MKRWLANLTIVTYLGAVSFGLFAHTFKFMESAHPAMYFVVWDMYCGWASYSLRTHILAEGESGKFYDVSAGPWGETNSTGCIARQHYDTFGNHPERIANNVLAHTDHEPIVRIYVIDESWSKKYNLPDHIWRKRFDEPKVAHHYYHLWEVLRPDGTIAGRDPRFLEYHIRAALTDNPRLAAEMRTMQPFFAIAPHRVSAEAEHQSVDSLGLNLERPKTSPNAN